MRVIGRTTKEGRGQRSIGPRIGRVALRGLAVAVVGVLVAGLNGWAGVAVIVIGISVLLLAPLIVLAREWHDAPTPEQRPSMWPPWYVAAATFRAIAEKRGLRDASSSPNSPSADCPATHVPRDVEGHERTS